MFGLNVMECHVFLFSKPGSSSPLWWTGWGDLFITARLWSGPVIFNHLSSLARPGDPVGDFWGDSKTHNAHFVHRRRNTIAPRMESGKGTYSNERLEDYMFFHVNATKLVDRENSFPNMLMKLLKYWAGANNVFQCMSFMYAVKFAQVLSLGDFHQMERLRGVTILELRRDFRWDLDETFLRPVIQCHESSGTHCRVDTWPTPSVSLKHWDRFCWIGSGPHCPPW